MDVFTHLITFAVCMKFAGTFKMVDGIFMLTWKW